MALVVNAWNDAVPHSSKPGAADSSEEDRREIFILISWRDQNVSLSVGFNCFEGSTYVLLNNSFLLTWSSGQMKLHSPIPE